MKEKLSALIDGELDELEERRVLKALAGDVELRRTWERYHLIRAAVTRQLGTLSSTGLAEKVWERLEAEGTRETAPPLRFWPLAGGFAAAAAVAAVAIVGLQFLTDPVVPPPTASAPAAVAPAAVPVATASATAATTASAAAVPLTPPAEESSEGRLSQYLLGHNEFMPTSGMGGLLPYVRVVAHGRDK